MKPFRRLENFSNSMDVPSSARAAARHSPTLLNGDIASACCNKKRGESASQAGSLGQTPRRKLRVIKISWRGLALARRPDAWLPPGLDRRARGSPLAPHWRRGGLVRVRLGGAPGRRYGARGLA